MIEAVRGYLLRLCAGAFFSALLLAVIPQGTPRRMAALLCSLLLAFLALSPLAGLDYDALSESIGRLELAQEQARTGIALQNRELTARIISERVEAYILDKAAELGLDITVQLQINAQAGTPYPEAVTIYGAANTAQRQRLQRYIEQNLGIAPERQEWLP